MKVWIDKEPCWWWAFHWLSGMFIREKRYERPTNVSPKIIKNWKCQSTWSHSDIFQTFPYNYKTSVLSHLCMKLKITSCWYTISLPSKEIADLRTDNPSPSSLPNSEYPFFWDYSVKHSSLRMKDCELSETNFISFCHRELLCFDGQNQCSPWWTWIIQLRYDWNHFSSFGAGPWENMSVKLFWNWAIKCLEEMPNKVFFFFTLVAIVFSEVKILVKSHKRKTSVK